MIIFHTKNGFTLIEVLIGMFVLAVGILTLISMQTASVLGNNKAHRITEASALGSDLTERFYSLPYDAGTNGYDDDGDGLTDEADEDVFDEAQSPYTLASFADNGEDDDNDGETDEADEGAPDNYWVKWTVQDNTPVSGTKKVTVSVDYRSLSDGKIINSVITLNTLKTH